MAREADKRERILEAAIKLFVEKGFDATSMADIAARADVAKGTTYLYFSSKEHLIEQVFWYCHRRDAQACAEGLEEIPGAVDKLSRRMRNAIFWAMRHPEESRIERMYNTSPQFGSRSRYTKQTLHFEAVDEIVRNGLESGELKELPSPLLGEMFFGIGSAALNYMQDNPERLEEEALWEAFHECVVGCLKKPEK